MSPISLFAALIIAGGFLGWLTAFVAGGDTTAQSTGTGYGCAAGLLVAVAVFFWLRNARH